MTPGEYLDQRAELLVDLAEATDAARTAYFRRWRELLENPEERSELIIDDAIGYLVERDAEDAGSDAASEEYAGQLLDYTDYSWTELQDIAPDARGDMWHTGRKLVGAICQTQAYFETLADSIIGVADNAADLTSRAAAMSEADKKQAATEGTTKQLVRDKAEARKAARVNTEG